MVVGTARRGTTGDRHRSVGRLADMPADPRPASEPVHDVDVLLDVRIPVRDGLELSANLLLPVPAPEAPTSASRRSWR